MRRTILGLTLIVGLGLGLVAVLPLPAAEKATAEQIDRLVQQLGSTSFADREQATRLLDEIGPPALAALRKAAQSSDIEVRRRAEELVKKIEQRGENAALLAPTRVRLSFKDTLVAEAVAELAKQSKYTISLHDPQKKLADRKVTLDTGDVSFWEAFDRLCVAASLTEATPQDLTPPRPPLPGRPIRPGLPPRPVPQPVPPAEQPRQEQGAAGAAGAVEVVVAAQPGAAPAGKPVQIQVGQGQAVPAIAIAPQPGVPMAAPNQIVLKDGKPAILPTDYAGAVRVQALAQGVPQRRGNEPAFGVMLQVSPEPKLRWQNLMSVRIDRAVDERDQNLQALANENPAADPNAPVAVLANAAFVARPPIGGMGGHIPVPVRLKKGNQDAKMLKEMEGVITAQVWGTPQAMITVDDVLQATGKTIKGAAGGSITVHEVKREKDGSLKVRLEMETPPNVLPAGQPAWGGFGGIGGVIQPLPIQIQPLPAPVPPQQAPPGNGLQFQQVQPAQQVQPVQVQIQIAPIAGDVFPGIGGGAGLTLVDEKGGELKPTQVQQQVRPGANRVAIEQILTFAAPKAEKPKLVFSGSKSATVDIAFKLKNVPLP